MSTNILMVNVHSMANTGDAVLNQTAVAQLQKSFPNASITLAMNDPEGQSDDWQVVASFFYWMKDGRRWVWGQALQLLWDALIIARRYRQRKSISLNQKKWQPLLQAYLQADLVVSCPGNFLYSSGKIGFTLMVAAFTIAYGWLLDKPVYMMPQTIGPLKRRWEKSLVRWLLQKIQLVLVRDAVSWQELKRLGFDHPHCYQTPDLAFAFPKSNPEAANALFFRNGLKANRLPRPLLGVSVIDWGAQNLAFNQQAVYETAVADTIRSFITEHNGYVILFPQVQGPTPADDDRIPARRIYRQLEPLNTRIIYLTENIPPAMLKAAYGYMDLFLGTRLHANIFALSEGVPIVAIQYQYKTRGILSTLGLEQWVIDIENVQSDNLIALLEQAWKFRLATRKYIQNILPSIIHEAEQAGSRIADHYYA